MFKYLINEKGKTYGKLKVLEYSKNNRKWKCQCKCGNIAYVRGSDLRAGKTKSCGCELSKFKAKEDLTNKKFGRLTPIQYAGKSKWLCKCDCGKEIITTTNYLKSGHTKSCGCINDEKRSYTKYKNDKRAKSLYKKWDGIHQRCYNPKSNGFENYGGKGIKMCDEWRDSFDNFFLWAINNGYEEVDGDYRDRLAIDRIDSEKDYCPDNCRFISISDNGARVSEVYQHLEELNKMSSDEMVQDYINRKMDHNLEIQAEKKKIRSGGFFARKNNYCILKNDDRTKQFLFKSYRVVSMFLNITPSAVSYRVKNKNGILSEGWKLEKLTKEEFEHLRRQGIEVIV